MSDKSPYNLESNKRLLQSQEEKIGEKRKSPAEEDKSEEDSAYVKRFDEHRQGIREFLVKVVALFKKFEIPVADEYLPNHDGNPLFYWRDKGVSMTLVYGHPSVIEMDIGRNPTVRIEDFHEAINKLANLLDTPKCSYRLRSSGPGDE